MSRLIETGENPVRVIRNGTGLSLRRAADKVPCTYQALTYVEYAMYDRILPTVLDWVVSVGDYTEYEIETAYALYQMRHRHEAAYKYGFGSLSIVSLGEYGKNPIKALRHKLGLSQYRFCRDLCIPVALLYTAENTAVSFPKSLRDVLYELGVPDRVLSEIASRYEVLDV